MTTCINCHAGIVFLVSSTGAYVPVDAWTVTSGELSFDPDEGHVSHYTTCPDAVRWGAYPERIPRALSTIHEANIRDALRGREYIRQMSPQQIIGVSVVWHALGAILKRSQYALERSESNAGDPTTEEGRMP